jgi:hypothetical protein
VTVTAACAIGTAFSSVTRTSIVPNAGESVTACVVVASGDTVSAPVPGRKPTAVTAIWYDPDAAGANSARPSAPVGFAPAVGPVIDTFAPGTWVAVEPSVTTTSRAPAAALIVSATGTSAPASTSASAFAEVKPLLPAKTSYFAGMTSTNRATPVASVFPFSGTMPERCTSASGTGAPD